MPRQQYYKGTQLSGPNVLNKNAGTYRFLCVSGVLITLAPPRLLAIDFSEAPHLIIVYLAGALFHARYYLFTESSLSHPKTDLRNTKRAKPEEANPRSLRRYITNTSAKHSLWDSLDVGLRSSVGQKRF